MVFEEEVPNRIVSINDLASFLSTSLSSIVGYTLAQLSIWPSSTKTHYVMLFDSRAFRPIDGVLVRRHNI